MLEQIIQDISHQGWSYQLNVIDKERLSLLTPMFSADFAPARVGKEQALQRLEAIRGDFIFWLDPLNVPNELAKEFHLLEELKQELNRNFFLGLKEFEAHLAKYPVGTFYKKHIDRFALDSSRSLSFIFYLHEEWNPEDGGELVLYNHEGEVVKTILPTPGSMICFLSGDFPHEVKTCSRERRSLTGWMHTKIIT